MIKSLNDIALRHLNGIYIQTKDLKNEDKENRLNIREFATIIKKFEGFGYTFEKSLALKFSQLNKIYAIELCKKVLENIKDFKSDKNYTVFYKNFPNEVINMSESEIYLNQILHYWFGYLPKDENENFTTENQEINFSEPSQLVNLSHLKLVTENDIEKLFSDLLSSNITLSEQYLNDACLLSDIFSNEKLEKYAQNIKMKETLVTFSKYILEKRNILIGNFTTATDILRLVAKISDDELNNKYIHFAYFNRSILNEFMKKLDAIPDILPDIKRYRKPWHKFFLLYSKKINFNRYLNVKRASNMLFGEFSYETPKGYFEKMRKNIPNMTTEEIKDFAKRFSKYSGDYVRQILSLLNISKQEHYHIFIEELENCMKNVNTRVLFQLYDRILNLLEKSKRIVNSKGIWRNLEETIFLSENLLEYLLEVVKNAILEHLRKNDKLGNIYIDENYKNIMITTSEKDSNISLRPMARGSKISFNKEADVLRFFVGWKNIEVEEYNKYNEKVNYSYRVDIDLSTVCFDENFKFVKTIAYYNQKEKYFAFSGDITDAPEGALEYIDIYELNKVLNEGIKYILMSIRSYNGYSFDEINSVYAGVMELTKKEAFSDRNMYSSSISHGFQILSKGRTTNTILIDLEKCECRWIDMNMPVLENYENHNRLNNSDIAKLEDILEYFVNKKYITMYELLSLNAEARGTLVFDSKIADISFEKIDGDNPLPLANILANYF